MRGSKIVVGVAAALIIAAGARAASELGGQSFGTRRGRIEPFAPRSPSGNGGYRWEIPLWVPPPREPADNPTTTAKVDLGRHLFYDKRLSANLTMSCATCHQQARAFTDGRPTAVGITGAISKRNSMSLTNVAYLPTLT